MVAAFYKHADCVRVLLERGASFMSTTTHGGTLPMPRGSTVLHCAARSGGTRAALDVLKCVVRSAFDLINRA